MASAFDAHQILKQFSIDPQTNEENAGVAVSKEMLRRLILNAYASVASGQAVALPSTQQFEVNGTKLFVYFDASVDLSNLGLDFLMTPGSGGEDVPVVISSGISMRVSAYLSAIEEPQPADRVHIGAFDIGFSSIEAMISMEARQLQLTLLGTQQAASSQRIWEADQAVDQRLRTEFGFQDEDFVEAGYLLGAIMLLLPDLLAETYLGSIDLPDIFALFPGVKFEGQGRLAAQGEFLLFTADTELNFEQCPVAPPDGEVTTEPDPNGGGQEVPPNSPSRDYPPGYGDEDRDYASNGHLFLFTPQKLLEANFNGVARPAVGFGESGRKGIFKWGYKASLMLNSFALSMTQRPLEFLIEMSLGAVGYGDCKVKIGCVTHRVGGIAFQGDIEPLDIIFKIHLDYRRREVVFISKIRQSRARNFDFMNSAPWPLSAVADHVMKRASEKAMRDQAGKILAKTRIPIGRWRDLASVAPMYNVLAVHEDQNRDSVTIGALFDLEA